MASEEFNEMMRAHYKKHQATVETFEVMTITGKAKVHLIKVKESLENTIGIYVNVGTTQLVMLGERRVDRPEPGFRYHEFKTPGRAGFCRRKI